uniref:Platelet glycoprotein 4 n=1 Tax=Pavo cristatus TaxID=9049 RepID=A0A8C9LF42_PAVCR
FTCRFCVSIYGVYQTSKIVKGIPLYRFTVPREAFASPIDVGDNYCFCTDEVISQNCTLAGVLDISSCKAGRPVYISLPHFLHASESILHDVEGLSPNEEEHETFLDVEPCLATLPVARRLQLENLRGSFPPNEVFAYLPFTDVFIALFQSAVIGDEKAEMFRNKVTGRVQLLGVVQMALIIAGSVLFLAFMGSYFICRTKKLK